MPFCATEVEVGTKALIVDVIVAGTTVMVVVGAEIVGIEIAAEFEMIVGVGKVAEPVPVPERVEFEVLLLTSRSCSSKGRAAAKLRRREEMSIEARILSVVS